MKLLEDKRFRKLKIFDLVIMLAWIKILDEMKEGIEAELKRRG